MRLGQGSSNTGPSRRSLLAGVGASGASRLFGGLSLAGAGAVAGTVAGASPAAAGDAYDALRAAWLSQLAGTTIDPSDPAFATALANTNSVSQTRYTSLDTSASRTYLWSDLPLGSVSANVTGSYSRLYGLAVNWATPGGTYYQNSQVATDVISGLDWLYTKAYNASATEYNNWWDWEIGTPQALLNAMTILYPQLTATQIANWLAAVDHFDPDPTKMQPSRITSTGANRVDLCQVVITRGIIGKSSAKISTGQAALSPVFPTTLVADGLHPDGSFLQHTAFAYTGTYGMVWLGGAAKLVTLLAGSTWAVTDPNLATVYSAVTEAFAPMVYNGLMLDSVRGRAISRIGERDADDGLSAALTTLLLAGSASVSQAATFRSLAKGMLTRNTVRPASAWATIPGIVRADAVLNDSSIVASAEPVGSRLFADMDRLVHRRPGWAYSLSLASSRVERYESINGENVHGWHTGDGMAQLYLDSDIAQFSDEFWETVNPARLPGITVDAGLSLAASAGQATTTGLPWVGGATLGGLYSAVGFDFQAYGATLAGKKSWFCLDDCVVALGAGITSTDGRVIETVVEARNLGDPATTADPALTVNGSALADGLGTTQTLASTSWAALAGVGGYLFLDGPGGAGHVTVKALREDRTGSWTDVNTGQVPTPTFPSLGPFTRRYQQIWLDHGTSPAGAGYGYVVLPGFTAAQTSARAAAPNVSIVANTATVQAIGHSGLGLTAANFFAAGTAGSVSASGPCSVLVQEQSSKMTVAVSDPGRTATTLTVTIATSTAYVSAVADSGVSVLSVSGGHVTLLVEVGGSRGGTRSVTLTTDSAHPVVASSSAAITPSADSYVRDGSTYAGVNYGTATSLLVKNVPGSPAGYNRTAYFKFPLTGTGTVTRAVLWVHGVTQDSNGNQQVLQAYGVADTSWTESGITYTNAPALGTALGSAPVTSAGDWAPLDVTAFVAQQAASGTVSLAVWEAASGLGCAVNSKENTAYRPFLEVVSH